MFDSRPDTYQHIAVVRGFLLDAAMKLVGRAHVHDQSKLGSPEKEVFDEFTPKLKETTYGSAEYQSCLDGMKPALDHHYAVNSHHPEHFSNGIQGMTLLDLVEMICDWLAAVQRHDDGDIVRSIEINQDRFGYSDELKEILLNTVAAMDP